MFKKTRNKKSQTEFHVPVIDDFRLGISFTFSNMYLEGVFAEPWLQTAHLLRTFSSQILGETFIIIKIC